MTGNTTESHPRLMAATSIPSVIGEAEKVDLLIFDLCGKEPAGFGRCGGVEGPMRKWKSRIRRLWLKLVGDNICLIISKPLTDPY